MNNKYKIISENLKFREITNDDFDSIHNILKDKEIMYAWGHGFSKEETRERIEKNKIDKIVANMIQILYNYI